MGLSNKYDQFYKTDGQAHALSDYPVRKCPLNRVEEIVAVSGAGGWLVINTPNIALIKKRFLLALGRFPATSQPNEGLGSDVLFDGGHLHYFTYRSLRLVLERAGFEMVRPMGFGRLGFFPGLWPSLVSVGV